MTVDPLDASGVGSPAVELFVSTAVRGGGAVHEAGLAAVVEICRSLDGLPLAIELTAAQVRHLDPAEILERLDRRFELVARGRSRGNRRQASLKGVLVDTWALLDDVEQALLLHLAAFPSSFDLETAEELFGPATPRALSGLVDRCLVVRDATDHTYRLLETVKLFGRSRWPQRAALDHFRDRHADALLAHVERWSDDDIYSLDEVLGWHARHVDDLLAADDHLHARDDDLAAAKLWSSGAILWHLGRPALGAVALHASSVAWPAASSIRRPRLAPSSPPPAQRWPHASPIVSAPQLNGRSRPPRRRDAKPSEPSR